MAKRGSTGFARPTKLDEIEFVGIEALVGDLHTGAKKQAIYLKAASVG